MVQLWSSYLSRMCLGAALESHPLPRNINALPLIAPVTAEVASASLVVASFFKDLQVFEGFALPHTSRIAVGRRLFGSNDYSSHHETASAPGSSEVAPMQSERQDPISTRLKSWRRLGRTGMKSSLLYENHVVLERREYVNSIV